MNSFPQEIPQLSTVNFQLSISDICPLNSNLITAVSNRVVLRAANQNDNDCRWQSYHNFWAQWCNDTCRPFRLELPAGASRQISFYLFHSLSQVQPFCNPFHPVRKIVLDKRTIAWFNDCNPILHQTKDAEVKLSAHPQRVSHS